MRWNEISTEVSVDKEEKKICESTWSTPIFTIEDMKKKQQKDSEKNPNK